MLFYAAIHKYMDDLDPHQVTEFERGLYPYMDSVHPGVGRAITSTGDLSEETEAALKKGLDEYRIEFKEKQV
jgi:F-type H+-transporting ATPase subunit alpha